jgi:hypothetical protein
VTATGADRSLALLESQVGRSLPDVETPVAVIDLDRLEANLTDLQSYADAHGIALWPHAKTHKSPEIGRRQLELGAAGLTVAKTGEAQVFQEGAWRSSCSNSTSACTERARRRSPARSPSPSPSARAAACGRGGRYQLLPRALSAWRSRPHGGEHLRIVPNHACGCINLHDAVLAVRDGVVDHVIRIAGRGLSR